MKKHFLLFFIIGLLSGTTNAQCDSIEYYQLMYISTDSIYIGDKWCHTNDTISDCDIVYWNEDLNDQAIQARSLKQTSKMIKMAKQQVRAIHRHNTSIRGLFGKGDRIDVILNGESYVINCEKGSNYTYKVYFNNNYDSGLIITPTDGRLMLNWDLLKNFYGITTIKVYRENAINTYDIRLEKTCVIDIVQ